MTESTGNCVTQAQIDALLDAAETQEHIFWEKELLISYRLQSGFTVTGRGACVDPKNFDLSIGRRVARQDASNQLWQLEGYRLQLSLQGKL
ncbi:MAG: Gp49 family protein [Stenomitos frigidus ULC029]